MQPAAMLLQPLVRLCPYLPVPVLSMHTGTGTDIDTGTTIAAGYYSMEILYNIIYQEVQVIINDCMHTVG